MGLDEKKYERIVSALREREVDPRFKESVWRRIRIEAGVEESTAVRILQAGVALSAVVAVVIGVLAVINFGGGKGDKVVSGKPYTLRENMTLLTGGGGQILAKTESHVQITAGKNLYKMVLSEGHLRFNVPRLPSGFVFSVDAGLATVTVKGTVFEVAVDLEAFSVEVFEGSVLCASRDGERVVVSGQSHTVKRREEKAGGPLKPGEKAEPPGEGAGEAGIAEKTEKPAVATNAPAGGGKAAKKAEPAAEKAAPGHDDAAARADHLLKEKKYTEAAALLTSAYEGHKEQSRREELLFKRGQVELFNVHDYGAAIGTFGEYLKNFSGGKFADEATYHTAEAMFKNDDVKGAIEWFERYAAASANDSRKASALYNIAALSLRAGKPCGDTVPYLTNALALKPPPDIEIKALRAVVSCLVSTGKKDAAKKHLERLETLDPTDQVLRDAKRALE
ncbi:MAG: tetratricopeptide repeat protein [Deltaproteobacteria bacterium]|nr:tetratricopeptide repeat protein [Deltaproteobacteria bacterium]